MTTGVYDTDTDGASTSHLSDVLLNVIAHVTALQMKTRALCAESLGDPAHAGVLKDLHDRTDELSNVTADAVAYIRETHTVDPFLVVNQEHESIAISLIAAYFDTLDEGRGDQLLYDLIGDLFSEPEVAYRNLAAIIAALARAGARLASHGDDIAPAAALGVVRACLLAP